MSTRGPGVARVWASWYLGIVAWGLHLLASYGLVEWYCVNVGVLDPWTVKLMLHGITVFCLLLAVVGTGLAWRYYRALRKENGNREVERSRFITGSGILLSAFMAVLIVVEAIPNLVFEPCF